jgi:uncharacterized membrane protein
MLRWLRRAFEALLALLILFEEWGWEPLKRAMARLMQLPGLRWVERAIVALPPWAALLVFLLPTLMLLPLKLAAFWLMAHAQKSAGVAVVVAAKLVGTALVARLVQLTQPALMTLGWFARFYNGWMLWKQAWMWRIRAS